MEFKKPDSKIYAIAKELTEEWMKIGIIPNENVPDKKEGIKQAMLGITLLKQVPVEDRKKVIDVLVGALSERQENREINSLWAEHVEAGFMRALEVPSDFDFKEPPVNLVSKIRRGATIFYRKLRKPNKD